MGTENNAIFRGNALVNINAELCWNPRENPNTKRGPNIMLSIAAHGKSSGKIIHVFDHRETTRTCFTALASEIAAGHVESINAFADCVNQVAWVTIVRMSGPNTGDAIHHMIVLGKPVGMDTKSRELTVRRFTELESLTIMDGNPLWNTFSFGFKRGGGLRQCVSYSLTDQKRTLTLKETGLDGAETIVTFRGITEA